MVHTRPSHCSLFLGFVKVGRCWPGSLRLGAAAIVPSLVGITVFGQSAPAAITALGAFASVYGEGWRDRTALWRVFAAAVLMVLFAAFGSSVGSVVHAKAAGGDSSLWWLLMMGPMTAIAVIGASVVDWLEMGPPGVFLPLLTVVISSTLPGVGVAITSVVGWTAAGAITAMMISISDRLFRRRFRKRTEPTPANATLLTNLTSASLRHASPVKERSCEPRLLGSSTIRYILTYALRHDGREQVISLQLLFSCLISGLIALGTGIDRPDWAVITAAMILHLGPDHVYGTYRGIHRLVGTIAGLCVVFWLAPIHFDGSGLAMVVALLIVGIQAFLVRNYMIAMMFITPLAILLGSLGKVDNLAHAIGTRLLETVVGVTVAIAVLWSVRPCGISAADSLLSASGQLSGGEDPISRAGALG